MLIADNTAKEVFGTIKPVGPAGSLSLSVILSWGIRIFFFALGLLALYYMLMGAFEWTNSGGDEKKITDAKNKITQSLVAMLIAVAILVGWVFLSTQILGIFRIENGQLSIKIPTINCKQTGATHNGSIADCCSQEAVGALCK